MNNLHKELHKIGKEIVQTLRDGLGKYGLDNSDLANSITYNIRNNELIIDMNEYGKYVDSGRAPGSMPPVDKLMGWAQENSLNVWGVAKNIEKYGIEPKPFLFNIDNIVDRMGERISDAGFKDFVDKTDEIFSKNFTIK